MHTFLLILGAALFWLLGLAHSREDKVVSLHKVSRAIVEIAIFLGGCAALYFS